MDATAGQRRPPGRAAHAPGGLAMPLALAVAGGIALAGVISCRWGVLAPGPLFWLGLLLAGTLAAAALAVSPSGREVRLLLVTGALLAGTYLQLAETTAWQGWPPLTAGAEVVLAGQVISSHRTGFLLAVSQRQVDAASPNNRSAAQSGRVWVSGAGSVSPGYKVVVAGVLRQPAGPSLPGLFNEQAWIRSRGAAWRLVAAQPVQAAEPAPGWRAAWRRRAAQVRDALLETWQGVLPPETAALLQGVVLGDRGGLAPARQRQLADAGLIHLTAVSGFHLGLVAALPLWWLSARRRAPALQVVLSAPLIVVYLSLAGLEPPAFRALIMGATGLVAAAVQRRGEPLQGLALAALLLLLSGPSRLYSLSFQLSFAATAGIIILTEPLARTLFRRLPGHLQQGMAVTTAAQLGILPLALHTFQQISLIAPLANLLAVPAVVIIVALALGLIALSLPLALAAGAAAGSGQLAMPALLAPLWQAVQPASSALIWVAETMAAWPAAAYHGAWPGWAVAGYYLLFAAAWVCWRHGLCLPGDRRRFPPLRRLPLLLLVAAGILTAGHGLTGVATGTVTVLDAGAGRAVVVIGERGETLVYGPGGTPWQLAAEPLSVDPAAERVLLPVLRAAGVRRIDALVLAGAQLEVSGAALDLVRAMEVGAVILPAETAASPPGGAGPAAAAPPAARQRLTALADLSRRRGIPVHIAHAGVSWPVGRGRVTVVSAAASGLTLALDLGDAAVEVTGAAGPGGKDAPAAGLGAHSVGDLLKVGPGAGAQTRPSRRYQLREGGWQVWVPRSCRAAVR